MTGDLLLGLGLVAVVEGLALALAPGRLADMLELLRGLGPERARMLGLFAIAMGVALVWLARA